MLLQLYSTPTAIFSGEKPWRTYNFACLFFSDYWCICMSLGFAFTSPTKIFTYKSSCILMSALISRLKICPKFTTTYLLCLSRNFILPQIFLVISGGIQGIEETELLVFEGIHAHQLNPKWMNVKFKFSCTDRASEWPLKYFSFANLSACFLIVS